MKADKQFYKDSFGWGFVLWLFGYILSIILFMVMSPTIIGWIIAPVATFATIWVLYRKIHSTSFQYYVKLAVVWTLLAVILDYFFIVKMFKPIDGYYKADVYLYYGLTFLLPLFAGWHKKTDVLPYS